MPSGPGVELDLHLFSIPLMAPGVIGEMSNSCSTVGAGIYSRTQGGSEVYAELTPENNCEK